MNKKDGFISMADLDVWKMRHMMAMRGHMGEIKISALSPRDSHTQAQCI